MQGTMLDLRFAVRLVLRRPLVSLVVILTLALGIGANTAIFSIVHALLLLPLPFEEPDQLVFVAENFGDTGNPGRSSYVDLVDFREQSATFSDVAGLWYGTANLSGGGEPERVLTSIVSPSYFSLLGVNPVAGADFAPTPSHLADERQVLLSETLWRSRFGGDRGVIGQTLQLDGVPSTVVGVMPALESKTALAFGPKPALWQAMNQAHLGPYATMRGARWIRVIARLEKGVTLAEAQGEMDSMSARWRADYPDSHANWTIRVDSFRDHLVGNSDQPLLLLVVAVSFVLLIACTNVANLQLARATSRIQEVAVRMALGSGRQRLVRQMLTESLVLALLGGIAGVGLALLALTLPSMLGADNFLPMAGASLDLPVLLFTLILSITTGLLFGLAPALFVIVPSLASVLREGGRTPGLSSRRTRLRRVLVIAEVGFAFTLLIGAGLMIKSFSNLHAVDPGYRNDGVLTMEVSLPDARYSQASERDGFFQAFVDRIRSIPGVNEAGAVSHLPLKGSFTDRSFLVEGQPSPEPGQSNVAQYSTATSGYFEAMGIELKQGRTISSQDTAESPRVLLINETLARRFLANQNPIGVQLKVATQPSQEAEWRTVIGVVGDERYEALDAAVWPRIYVPNAQAPAAEMGIAIWTSGEPLEIAAAVRDVAALIDADQPIAAIATIDQIISDSLSSRRFVIVLLSIFATVAMTLAGVGIYGLVAFSVNERSSEIGLRLALGATRTQILNRIVGQGLLLAVVGIAFGALATIVASRFLQGLLFGVNTTDPMVYCGLAVLLMLVTLTASIVPACRAAGIEPMSALKSE